MNKLGTGAILALLVLGILIGVTVAQLGRARAPANPYPATAISAVEPAPAAKIATAIGQDDAKGLARAIDPSLLDPLGQALDPIVDVQDIRFVGASESAGTTLAAYVVDGRDISGAELLIGFTLDVSNNHVVGVN